MVWEARRDLLISIAWRSGGVFWRDTPALEQGVASRLSATAAPSTTTKVRRPSEVSANFLVALRGCTNRFW